MLGKVEILAVIIALLLAFYFVISLGAGKRKKSQTSIEIKRYFNIVRKVFFIIIS